MATNKSLPLRFAQVEKALAKARAKAKPGIGFPHNVVVYPAGTSQAEVDELVAKRRTENPKLGVIFAFPFNERGRHHDRPE